MLLSLKDVHAYYGTSHILQGISLEIAKGEVVTILGRNGAGKTTTARTIMGLLKKTEGQIVFHSEDISSLQSHVIGNKGFGYVPQERDIFGGLTVYENLKIGAISRKKHLKGIYDMNRIFDIFPSLYARRKNKGGSLSGGEQQMLSIARALMGEPELLILDEPTEGLAPIIVKELEEVIKKIIEEEITILLIDPHLKMVCNVAHRHYVMEHGRIVWTGTNDDFMRDESVKTRYLTPSMK